MLILLTYLTRRWLGVSLIITILLTIMLLLLALAEAASEVAAGRLPPGLFWWQLLFSLPETMDVVLPLAVMAGLIVSLGQLVLDREWHVMRSCGLRFRHLLNGVAAMALGCAVLMLVITGYLQPWAYRQQEALKEEAARSAQLWGVQAGRFVPIPGMDGVAYVSSVDDENFVLRDIFLVIKRESREEVITAAQGYYRVSEQGERYIELEQGQRVELPVQNLAVRSAQFGGGTLRIPQQRVVSVDAGFAAHDLMQLWTDSQTQARREFHLRMAAPIAVLILSLWGLVCATWGESPARAWRVLAGILVYVSYLQAVSLAQVRILGGDWSLAALYWTHFGFLLLVAGLLLQIARRY